MECEAIVVDQTDLSRDGQTIQFRFTGLATKLRYFYTFLINVRASKIQFQYYEFAICCYNHFQFLFSLWQCQVDGLNGRINFSRKLRNKLRFTTSSSRKNKTVDCNFVTFPWRDSFKCIFTFHYLCSSSLRQLTCASLCQVDTRHQKLWVCPYVSLTIMRFTWR